MVKRKYWAQMWPLNMHRKKKNVKRYPTYTGEKVPAKNQHKRREEKESPRLTEVRLEERGESLN